jgi:hypothetical protein
MALCSQMLTHPLAIPSSSVVITQPWFVSLAIALFHLEMESA